MVASLRRRRVNILITGGDGILATALRAHFPKAVYRTRAQCDVTDSLLVANTFYDEIPQLVIHCGAATAHDRSPMAYMEVNIVGTANIVRQCARHKARLIYPSTDYLGAKHEDDPVKPVNDYAASKLGGEMCVRMLPNSLIVRGSWYDQLNYDYAASNAFTSKIPVAQAAAWIAKLALSDATGVVNIGGKKRSIFSIVHDEFNGQVKRIRRQALDVGYDFPADSSLCTTRFQSLGLV